MRCSFCGKHQDQVHRLIAGPGAYICNECVQLCMSILEDEHDTVQTPPAGSARRHPHPQEIRKVLDQYIIGQEAGQGGLCLWRSTTTISGSISAAGTMLSSRRATSCSWGPPAAARPLFAQTLARILKVPFAIADATTLTEAGYVGDDVENILLRLVQAADYDVELAERGIIYIDEMDKIARKSENTSITRMCPARACNRPC